jgi:hypothetical protein
MTSYSSVDACDAPKGLLVRYNTTEHLVISNVIALHLQIPLNTKVIAQMVETAKVSWFKMEGVAQCGLGLRHARGRVVHLQSIAI